MLIQCLESSEYMEIRNALIVLTKVSSVFPVTKRSGINLEKRVIYVNKAFFLYFKISFCINLMIYVLSFLSTSMQVSRIKNDEREDLKVLATGVAAALAARKVSDDLNSVFSCSCHKRLNFF